MPNFQKTKRMLTFLVIMLTGYLIMARLGTTCLFRLLTGICCPACGMTRAWTSFLNGNIKMAFYYHPLFWFIPVIGILILFERKINKRFYNTIMFSFIILVMGCYFYRLFTNSPVVYINFSESLIHKILYML